MNLDKEVWFCHHCGWTGTLKGGVDRSRHEANWRRPEYLTPTYASDKGLSDKARAWLHQRGITDKVIERNGLTSGQAFMPQADAFVETIQFPFRRGGQTVNVKYRDADKNFRQEGRAEKVFYGLDDLAEYTVIVEGEIDKLSLEVAGIPACVSVPEGAPPSEAKNYASKFDFLANCEKEMAAVKTWAIAVDSDACGKKLEAELLHRLGRDRCVLVRWPEGCKDANETLLAHGIDGVLEAVYSAEPPPIQGAVYVRDILDRVELYRQRGMDPGLPLSWDGFHSLYRVAPGQFTVVTGIPGHGKSEFLDAMLMDLAEKHDWTMAVYSPENFPLEQHVAKLLEKRVRKPFRGYGMLNMKAEECRQGALWLNDRFVFINPPDEQETLDGVLGIAKQLILRNGVRGLVIDPWNQLEHAKPAGLRDDEYLSMCLTRLLKFARANQIHLWVVAHPTKLLREKGAKTDPVPTAYDISGGAQWRNKADNILCVWRDIGVDDGVVHVHVQKIKFKKDGRPGLARFVYDRATGIYQDVQQETPQERMRHGNVR